VTAPASRSRILVVDDDPAITTLYDEVLRTHGYDVVTAGSIAQAMEAMDRIKGDAQVLVVDLGLPDGDGSDFVRDAVAKFGARPTMFVSGWTDEMWQLSEAPGHWIVLRKPLPVKRLLAGVRWLQEGGPKPAELDEG
jgi:two-component system, OmpR family, KDP operon response regulator KdpE